MQTTNLSQPAAPLAGNPMLLTPDGATAADGTAGTLPAPPTATATATPVVTPAPVVAAPAPVKAVPVPAKVEPVPVVTTTAAPAEPVPVEAPAPAKAASGEFPNINVVPPQPEGTLLPVAERAKIIAELEALRAKQGGSAPKPPASQTKALTDEAANHGAEALKQIEKCSQEGAADLYPECAPED
ncbi:MAG: hypothetical protein ABJP87_19185 [Bauldia litoralis]|uniref:hypothetical protein n=1 Tax=Bauldia litoralis TaxID=665467 RepID=UPI003299AF13